MKVVMRSMKVPNRVAAASVAMAGSIDCRHVPSFVQTLGGSDLDEAGELRLRQLRAADAQRLDTGRTQKWGQSSVEHFIDTPSCRRALLSLVAGIPLGRQQSLGPSYLRRARFVHLADLADEVAQPDVVHGLG
jgi:hypothetical protein